MNEILKMCPSLLRQANAKGETLLHIASRYGHVCMVKVLIEHEESPQKEAARNNHLAVVKLLIEKGPGFSYSANDIGETPLYIAVERNVKDLVFKILESCTSPAHGGPLGRTTLHATIIWNDKGIS